jgi:hypothetical protein
VRRRPGGCPAPGLRKVRPDPRQTRPLRRRSAATLAGVGLNAALGWWQAGLIAALVIAALAVREGIETWQEDHD